MRTRYLAVLPALLAVSVARCGDDGQMPSPATSRDNVVEAAELTVEAGSARLAATVRRGPATYEIHGRLDLDEGYRLLGRTTEGPREYNSDLGIWIARVQGDYSTLVSGLVPPRLLAGWLDDHPPSLPLFSPAGRRLTRSDGAEDLIHLALLALTEMDRAAIEASEVDGETYRVSIGFDRAAVEPPDRDEDYWTLGPVLRRLYGLPVAVGLDAEDYVRRISFETPRLLPNDAIATPVRVVLRLSQIGEVRDVPLVEAHAIE